MKRKKYFIFIAAVLSVLLMPAMFSSCGGDEKDQEETTENTTGNTSADEKGVMTGNSITDGLMFKDNFRKGINLGNTFEAPSEGEWGIFYEPLFFQRIKEQGFDFVRLPVSWSTHIDNNGKINGVFFDRIVSVVDEAVKNNLGIIVNIHHFNEMNGDPEKNAPVLYYIWEQISGKFKNYPSTVVFEINNEPNTKLTTTVWNKYQNECIKVIRETNPDRKILVTAGEWGGPGGLYDLILPEDPNLLASFHYYDPFSFTHQGAEWSEGSDAYLGMEWLDSENEIAAVNNTFKKVKEWSECSGIPVVLGEFGAYSKADMASRVRWTARVREIAEEYGFAWSYWEFCSGFGIYDKDSDTFNELADVLTRGAAGAKYGTKTGSVTVNAARENGTVGPFSVDRNMKIICDGWTNMMLEDTDHGTQIITLGGNVSEWAHAYIVLTDLVEDTGNGFGKGICELTVKNINGSVTDFCVNLDNNGSSETQMLWMNEKEFKETGKNVIQNEDGTTTLVLDLNKAYKSIGSGNFSEGVRIKIFIESVPGREYDKEGSIEFISIDLH